MESLLTRLSLIFGIICTHCQPTVNPLYCLCEHLPSVLCQKGSGFDCHLAGGVDLFMHAAGRL